MFQGKMVTVSPFYPTARGDTFVFAEDDDDELFEGTTPSPKPSARRLSFTTVSRLLKPTQQPSSDFGRRPQQHPETTLEMTKPPPQMEARFQETPVMQITPISQTAAPSQDAASATEPPHVNATADTTTVPITTGTTEAPDPDAVVCSGRPFDSFMQLKNGSIYAFRGEWLMMS